MQEFAAFLQQRRPFPLFSAFLSAYTQLTLQIMILLGAWIRLAAIPFIINFIAAVVIASSGETFRETFRVDDDRRRFFLFISRRGKTVRRRNERAAARLSRIEFK